MAKHAHRFLLQQKKTWRCTLPGCGYFIHLGLAHILPGKQATCWDCGQEFTLDEEALTDEMPKCSMCRAGVEINHVPRGVADLKMEMIRYGANKVDELGRTKLAIMKTMNVITEETIEYMRSMEKGEDKPEVIEPTDD